VDLVSDIKSSEGAGISRVSAREERETWRMGLLGCVSAGRPTKTTKYRQTRKQVHSSTRTHTQTDPF